MSSLFSRRRHADALQDETDPLENLGYEGDDLEDTAIEDDAIEDDGLEEGRQMHRVLIPAAAAAGCLLVAAACLIPGVFDSVRNTVHSVVAPRTSTSAAVTPTPPTPSTGAVADSRSSESTGTAGSLTEGRPSSTLATSGPGRTSAEPSTASSADTPPTPEDLLAGPVDDATLSNLMAESLPDRLEAQDPAAAASDEAKAVVDLAWTALAQDLANGGWGAPHQQAAVLTTTAHAPGGGKLPTTVAVAFMWSATASSGDQVDRRLATIALTRGSGQWTVNAIRSQSSEP